MGTDNTLEEDVAKIQEAVFAFGRRINHPTAHYFVERRAGVELDKVSEVVMSCLIDKDDIELRLSDLANRLGVEPSSVSRKVQKMEEAGLVEKVNDPSDARAWRMHLTDLGKERLKCLNDARYEIFQEVLEHWPAEDRSRFADLFTKFTGELFTHLGEKR